MSQDAEPYGHVMPPFVQEAEPQIVLHLAPVAQGSYAVRVSHTGVEGGWLTVLALMVSAIAIVAELAFPGRGLGQNSLLQATLNVLRAFMQSQHTLQAADAAPRVELVREVGGFRIPRT